MRLLLFLLLSAVSVLAQGKPDFTGTWRMNMEKSAFDKQGPPKGATVLKVEHREPKLTETVFHEPEPKPMGNKMKATAKWDGAELVILTWGSFGTNEMRLTDRWRFSAGGKARIVLAG